VSRFANPTRTERYYFPDGCKCPGEPHEQDWVLCRTELGAEDVAQLNAWSGFGALGGVMGLTLLIKDWNLLGPDGEDMPVTPESIKLLWSDMASDHFEKWRDGHVRMTSLPNGSGGRSPNGSSATASPTRASRGRRSSTTSS